MGVANQKSIAWGIAEVLSKEGASIALTYQGDSFKKRVEPLAESIGSNLIFDVDVTNESSVDQCFNELSRVEFMISWYMRLLFLTNLNCLVDLLILQGKIF